MSFPSKFGPKTPEISQNRPKWIPTAIEVELNPRGRKPPQAQVNGEQVTRRSPLWHQAAKTSADPSSFVSKSSHYGVTGSLTGSHHINFLFADKPPVVAYLSSLRSRTVIQTTRNEVQWRKDPQLLLAPESGNEPKLGKLTDFRQSNRNATNAACGCVAHVRVRWTYSREKGRSKKERRFDVTRRLL